MAKRPKPIEVGDVRASVVRGPKDGRWYWRARRKGVRDTLWTGWATRDVAAQALAALVAVGLPSPRTDPAAVEVRTVGDLLRAWIAHQELRQGNGSIAPLTLRNYRTFSRYWLSEVDDVLVSQLTRAMVEDCALEWVHDGVAPRTVTVAISVLKQAIKWGSQRGHCPALDLSRLGPRVRDGEYVYNARTPTKADVAQVVAAIEAQPEADAVRLLAITGARCSEIVAARCSDYDPSTGVLRLHGKDEGRGMVGKVEARFFPLPAAGRAVCDRWHDPKDPSRHLLYGFARQAPGAIRKQILAACKATEIEPFTPHGLRRMVVMRLLDSGVNVKTVSLITGHSVKTLLKDYVRPHEGDIRRAVITSGLGEIEGDAKVIHAKFRAQNMGTNGNGNEQ